MSNLSKITDRIQKLIAMANNNPNESEASVAMERAYKLLAKHNLSMSSIEDKGAEAECGENFNTVTNGGPWARAISAGIAELYFCSFFYSKLQGRKEFHNFVGLEHNVALAQQIANTVLSIIHKEAKKASNGSTPFLNSFRNAASYRIHARCKELIKEAKAGELQEDGESVGTGMMLASVYETEQNRIEAYNKRMNPSLKTKTSRARSTNSSGSAAGSAAGNRVGLRPSIK